MNEEDKFYWNSLYNIAKINSTLFEVYSIYFNFAFGMNNENMEDKKNSLIELKKNTNNEEFNMSIFKRDKLDPINDEELLMEQFENLLQ